MPVFILRRVVVSCVVMLIMNGAHAQQNHALLDIRIPFSPEPVMIDGKPTLYYELHVKNISTGALELKSLVMHTSHVMVHALGTAVLPKSIGRPDGVTNDVLVLEPSASCTIYIELALFSDWLQKPLMHHVLVHPVGSHEAEMLSAEGPTLRLPASRPLVLGAPLRDGYWVAIYEPSWVRGHRRVMYTVDSIARIPGRFAIDFIKVNKEGSHTDGDENRVDQWRGYGADVLAVSDGVVAAVRTDFTESPTLADHPRHTAENATGNYISLDIGNNRYVFYEHLKPGSIVVKPGQRVKKGDVIAALGFTGQTTGPHLHFHVANANSPLGAEGIPFVFERFTLLGQYDDLGKMGKEVWTPAKRRKSKKKTERPPPNAVIGFRIPND